MLRNKLSLAIKYTFARTSDLFKENDKLRFQPPLWLEKGTVNDAIARSWARLESDFNKFHNIFVSASREPF